jgi:NAD(P)-dependent dehydrogenase (short-subunit alcohol dehydrogenase family)
MNVGNRGSLVNKRGQKLVVITGGAGGIGGATALKLAALDYYPILLDRDDSAGNKTLAGLEAAGFNSKFDCVELANEQQVEKAFAAILAEHKRVDALINLAGGTIHKKRIQDLALNEWQEILDANLKSTFLCCRVVTGAMKSRKAGSIVNTSSNFGFSGSPLHTAYSAAKYGIVGFSKSLALELAPYGIRVNCIAPGLTATDRVLSHHSRDAFEAMSRALPIGHAGEPGDVADGIAFLLSADSDYMTGQTLHVNGGMVLP